jgi:hypothetical protein
MIDITDEEWQQLGEDVALGMVSFGIPELYHIFEAIYHGDEEALAYHLKVAGIVHGLWFTGYKLVQAWELFRHGRTAMSFHHAMQGKGALMGQFARSFLVSPAAIPVLGVAAGVAYSHILSDPTHPHTRGLVQERKAGVVSFGGPVFY